MVASHGGLYSGEGERTPSVTAVWNDVDEQLVNRRWWFSCQLTDSCSAARWANLKGPCHRRQAIPSRLISEMESSANAHLSHQRLRWATPHPVVLAKISVLTLLSNSLQGAFRFSSYKFAFVNQKLKACDVSQEMLMHFERSRVRSCYEDTGIL